MHILCKSRAGKARVKLGQPDLLYNTAVYCAHTCNLLEGAAKLRVVVVRKDPVRWRTGEGGRASAIVRAALHVATRKCAIILENVPYLPLVKAAHDGVDSLTAKQRV